jgi:F-type H+-transporting ATPase subunit b
MTEAFLAEEQSRGVEMFLPEFPEVFWSALVVIVLMIVFYKYIMPKFTKVLDARAEKIEGNIEKAQAKLRDADQLLDKYNSQMEGAKVESAKIIRDANQHAQQLQADMKEQAEREYQLKLASAQKQIDDDVRSARLKLRKDLGDVVVGLAEKVLEEKFEDREIRIQSIDRFIETVGAGNESD